VPLGPVELVPVRGVPPSPAELDHRIYNRRVNFNCGKYFSEGWTFFRHNLCWILIGVLMWILVVVGFHLGVQEIVKRAFPSHNEYYEDRQGLKPMLLGSGLNLLVTILVFIPMASSSFVAVANAMRNNTHIRFVDFFSSFSRPYYYRLVALGFFVSLLQGICSLLIIPGIWFAIATSFVIPLHAEHQFLGIRQTIKYSIKVVHKNFCSMIGFLLLIGILQVIGILAFIVGILITLPLGFCAMCYAYHDLVGINGVTVLVLRPIQRQNQDIQVPQVVVPFQTVQPIQVQSGLHI